MFVFVRFFSPDVLLIEKIGSTLKTDNGVIIPNVLNQISSLKMAIPIETVST